jgi:hypothetical protein
MAGHQESEGGDSGEILEENENGKQKLKRHMFSAEICERCCKFPSLKSCVHGVCSKCCVEVCEEKDGVCPGHSIKKQKKDAEARLVESTLKRKEQKIVKPKKLLKRGTFVEETFEAMGDTVIVFSLRRYLATREYSQDHIESQRRGHRLSSKNIELPKAHRLAKRKDFSSLADFIQSKKAVS